MSHRNHFAELHKRDNQAIFIESVDGKLDFVK